jgi:hypothetical protein
MGTDFGKGVFTPIDELARIGKREYFYQNALAELKFLKAGK